MSVLFKLFKSKKQKTATVAAAKAKTYSMLVL